MRVDDQVRQRDRQEEHEADEIRDDHRRAAVEAVGERAGERSEHDRRQQLHDQHAAEGVVLRLVAVGERVASAVVASRPSQSPRLDSAVAYHKRRNGRTRRTLRIAATAEIDGSAGVPRPSRALSSLIVLVDSLPVLIRRSTPMCTP